MANKKKSPRNRRSTKRSTKDSDISAGSTSVGSHQNFESVPAVVKQIKDRRGRPIFDRCHDIVRTSILSHNSLVLNIRGFYNLFIVVLVVTNFQMVLKNMINYGTLVSFSINFETVWNQPEIFLCFLLMNVSIVNAWFIERLLTPYMIQPLGPLSLSLQIGNCGLLLALPYYTVTLYKPDPIASTLLLGTSIVWLFKIISFHHVCFDIRHAKINKIEFSEICTNEKEIEKIKMYPQCVNLPYLYRFVLMPTMCFQFYYPSTHTFNWPKFMRHVLEALACIALIKIIVEQYMFVTLRDTFTIADLQEIKATRLFFHFLERMLKLSIPNLYVWLLFFMLIFHHWCNILAEITRFGDCLFYEDWWNASSLEEYWRRWNLPIYRFLNRHINKPLLSLGIPKFLSSSVVFFISALIHEYMISVPLQLGWIGIAFASFMAQLPLIYLTNLKFFQTHKTIGNIFFWITFCFTGQPIGILSYFYLWALKQGTVSQLDVTRIYIA